MTYLAPTWNTVLSETVAATIPLPEASADRRAELARRQSCGGYGVGDLAADEIHREAHIVEADVAFEGVTGRAVAAVAELGDAGQAHWTDIDAIFVGIVVDTVLGVAAAAIGALEREQRKRIGAAKRIVVTDQFRGQRGLPAHRERTVDRRADAEIGGIVEHLAGAGKILERVLEPEIGGQAVVLGDAANAVGIVAARGIEHRLQVEDGVEIVADLLLAAQADERVTHLARAGAEVRTVRILRNQVIERCVAERVQRAPCWL